MLDHGATYMDRITLMFTVLAVDRGKVLCASPQHNCTTICGNDFEDGVEYFSHQLLSMAQPINSLSDSEDHAQVAGHAIIVGYRNDRLLSFVQQDFRTKLLGRFRQRVGVIPLD